MQFHTASQEDAAFFSPANESEKSLKLKLFWALLLDLNKGASRKHHFHWLRFGAILVQENYLVLGSVVQPCWRAGAGWQTFSSLTTTSRENQLFVPNGATTVKVDWFSGRVTLIYLFTRPFAKLGVTRRNRPTAGCSEEQLEKLSN
jgi:hypothetical protein